MSKSSSKAIHWLLFCLSVVVALLLIVVGSHLLFLDKDAISNSMYWGFCVVSLIGAISVVVPVKGRYSWLPAAVLGALAFYFLFRAIGVIEYSWLAMTSGVICWATAVGIMYFMHPARTSVAVDVKK